MTQDARLEAARREQLRLLHALQSATRFAYEHHRQAAGTPAGYPTSDVDMADFRLHLLRAGADNALCFVSALARLLMAKGLIDATDYEEAVNQVLREELARHEQHARARSGARVTFG